MNKVFITIEGRSGSGKTLIAKRLFRALADAGITVEGRDGPESLTYGPTGPLPDPKTTKVLIKTRQL